MGMNSVVLIVNPRAGKCQGSKKLCDIVQTIQERGYLPTILITHRPGDARRFACEHGDKGRVICCVGGDGTLSEVISGMIAGHHDTPIGYIPAGSTNDYASSLGIPLDLIRATAQATDGVPRCFDVGMIDQQPFAYVAAFGTFAKVAYGTSQNLKNVLGHFAYILKGFCCLHSLRAESISIDADDEHFEGEYLLGAVGNSTSIGGIIRLNPDEVKLDDGYLELLLISKPATGREFLQLLRALCTRTYSACSCITLRKSRHVRITAPRSIPWTIDGEYASESRQVDIRNAANAIRVMLPRQVTGQD